MLDADVDVVLSVAASTPLAYARHGLPVVEVSDSTFGAVTGYYPQFSGLHAVARWQGEALGRRTSRRAAAFLLASDWAARSLVEDYGVDRGAGDGGAVRPLDHVGHTARRSPSGRAAAAAVRRARLGPQGR